MTRLSAKSAGSRSTSRPPRQAGKIRSGRPDWCRAPGRAPSRSLSRGSPLRRTRCRPASRATSPIPRRRPFWAWILASERRAERPGLSGRPTTGQAARAGRPHRRDLRGPSPWPFPPAKPKQVEGFARPVKSRPLRGQARRAGVGFAAGERLAPHSTPPAIAAGPSRSHCPTRGQAVVAHRRLRKV